MGGRGFEMWSPKNFCWGRSFLPSHQHSFTLFNEYLNGVFLYFYSLTNFNNDVHVQDFFVYNKKHFI